MRQPVLFVMLDVQLMDVSDLQHVAICCTT